VHIFIISPLSFRAENNPDQFFVPIYELIGPTKIKPWYLGCDIEIKLPTLPLLLLPNKFAQLTKLGITGIVEGFIVEISRLVDRGNR
jgi:hypothetical protein